MGPLPADLQLITCLPDDSQEKAQLMRLVELAIERRIANEIERSRDPSGVAAGIGCATSAAMLTAAAFYFHDWGWLLVPAVVLLIIGSVLFGLAVGKRRGDNYGNVIDG